MDPDRWRQVRALFDDIVELEPDQRARRLRDLATTYPELHAAVESLLAADGFADEQLKALEFQIVSDQTDLHAGDGSLQDPLGFTGRTISHFDIVELLASGGMGVLYRARDTRLNRDVALKFPLPWYVRDKAARERFLREGRAAGALDHPNLCNVYEVGETDAGQLFLAMALYAGETLKSRLERSGALPLEDAIAIFRQIVRGIGVAHAAGIIHRDLKPANLMVLPDGTVKILDFGLAKVTEPSLTGSGTRMGTVAYMAPEQVHGQAVDARTDLWALGVILYEMLTGRRPFDGEHDISVAHAIAHDDPVLPSVLRAEIPPALEDLMLQLLNKSARRRTPSAAVLETALEAVQVDSANSLRRRVARMIRHSKLRAKRSTVRRAAIVAVLVIAAAAFSTRSLEFDSALEQLTSNAQAQLLYDRGREYELRAESPENVNAAASLYARALELDPGFAHARARLALTFAAMYNAGYDRSPARLEQIRSEAEVALKLRPELADAHLAMGHYWDQGHRDNRRALTAFELALPGLPNSAELNAALGRLYRGQGRWDDAVSAYQRALQLNPMMLAVVLELSSTYSMLRRYSDGMALLDRLIELEPENHSAKLGKGYQVIRRDGTPDTLAAMLQRIPAAWDPMGAGVWARVMLARAQRRPRQALDILDASRSEWISIGGLIRHRSLVRGQIHEEIGDTAPARTDYDIARRHFEDSVAAHPRDPRWHIALGLTYAGLKWRSDAVREARLAMELHPISKDAMGGVLMMAGAAEVLSRVGDADGALELLDRLLAMPAGMAASVPLLRLDPTWDPLRNDPRFEQLLQRYSRNTR